MLLRNIPLGFSRAGTVALAMVLAAPLVCAAQEAAPPSMRAGILTERLAVDGVLDEPAWQTAERVDAFLQSDRAEGTAPTLRTTVQVLAARTGIAIGIVCADPDPSGVVSFSVRRDAALGSEDHVRVVRGPLFDGRSGYVFAVKPNHNVRSLFDRWQLDSNQLLVKLQYAWRL